MKFTVHKLQKDQAAATMRKVPVRLFKPYSLMLAPVYTLLERNEKFVAVKAPLSFFSETEIEKYKGVGDFYLPTFIDRIEPFQKAGEQCRRILGLTEVQKIKTSQGPKEAHVPISPFEASDAILQTLGPLWGEAKKIEPFFLVFLADEICDPIANERLLAAVDIDVERFELAVLRASLGVFIGLHVGLLNFKQLTKIRDRVFTEAMSGDESRQRNLLAEAVVTLSHRLLSEVEVQEIRIADFVGDDPVSRKIRSRLERVEKFLIPAGAQSSTLFGEGGICGSE